MTNETIQALTIEGSDTGAGCGLQADLKTFHQRKVFGLNIVIALTAQNSFGTKGVMTVDEAFIAQQFEAIHEDFKVRAAKVGMLVDTQTVRAVAKQLKTAQFSQLVVDPVMFEKSGYRLLEESAERVLTEEIVPMADVLTPNLAEAAAMVGRKLTTSKDMVDAAQELQALGANNIVIKGGHGGGEMSADYVLLADGEDFWLSAPRVETSNLNGTGDTFSACITAELAKGHDPKQAIITAKCFVQDALENPLSVGHGNGPTNQWATRSDHVEVHEHLTFEL